MTAVSSRTTAKRPTGRRRGGFNWLGTAMIVVLVLLWELVERIGLVTADNLPAPSKILSSAWQLAVHGETGTAIMLHTRVLHTLAVVAGGWAVSSLVAMIVGFLVGLYPWLSDWTMASFEMLRAIPGVALAPLSLMFFGFSWKMEFALVVFVAFWPVFMAVYVATRDRDASRAEVAYSLRMKRWREVTAIIAPSLANEIIVALRVAMGVALNLTILAEMLGNPEGLGNGLIQAQNALLPGNMFAYVVVASVLGLLLNWLLMVLFRLIFPGINASMTRRGAA